MMNIGILQCGKVHPKYAAQHGQYPEMFEALLKQVTGKLTYSVYDAENEELPTHPDACDAYLITGSHHGVYDNHPWIVPLEDFIRQVHYKTNKKMIGICFGHQLIMQALGGKVVKSPKGWGVGMSKNNITQPKPWMSPQLKTFNLLVSHQDQVIEIPKEAEILASNDFCPFYMLQIGNILTIQGHPEFTKAYVEAVLVEDRKAILDPLRYEEGIQSLKLDKDDIVIAQWLVNFLA